MKKTAVLAILLSLVLVTGAKPSALESSATKNLASLPLAFTENHGQWDPRVQFRANAGRAIMWFTVESAYYQFVRRTDDPDPVADSGSFAGGDLGESGRVRRESMVIQATFIGANPSPRMHGEDKLDARTNYFIGNDPNEWHIDITNYRAIVYEDIYPGIDLKYYGNGQEMEYDFIVSPGVDFSRIRIKYEGAESVTVNEDGELIVWTQWGEVIERRPVVYQVVNNSRIKVGGEYSLKNDNSFGFQITGDYDRNLPLVIDPVLSYSTYLGGGEIDFGYGIAVDDSGCAYVTGETRSWNFPTKDPIQPVNDSSMVFVAKLTSSGDGLVYSTYIGGWDARTEVGRAIAVDGSGCAYITGYTRSADFPTVNPIQTYRGGLDVFVTKINSSGSALVYSTYLGGTSDDLGYYVAVDVMNCAYVTGNTISSNFPTQNPYQTDQAGEDVFVTKLNSSGSGLVYSTYLGGSDNERGRCLAVDHEGCAYVTGYTYSTDFPTKNPYQSDQGEWDIFATKLSSIGNTLIYSTYLGGADNDYGYGIAVDAMGFAYITGASYSSDFPTVYPYQTDQGEEDAIVAKIGQTGGYLSYSTYLGGGQGDWGYKIAVDSWNGAFITGETESPDFPILNPYQFHQGGWDPFVTSLKSGGNYLSYSTYLGGSGIAGEWGNDIAVDAWGYAYVTGSTSSTDFPTENPFQTDQPNWDAFITKLDWWCCLLRGDINKDGSVDPLDAIYLVVYLWRGGPPPYCMEEADVDGRLDDVTPLDATWLVSYFWNGGPAPPPCL